MGKKDEKKDSLRVGYKGSELFDKNNYLQRKLPDQEQFEVEMGQELVDFKLIQETAFNDLLNERKQKNPNAINRNWNANTMNGNVKQHLIAQFPEHIQQDGSGRFLFKKDEKYVLFFKKLNPNLMPSNIPTKNSERILNQLAFPFEEPIPIVFIGYTVNDWDSITGHYAVCIHNGVRKWVTDLTTLGGSSRLTIAATSPVAPPPDIRVAVKKKAQ